MPWCAKRPREVRTGRSLTRDGAFVTAFFFFCNVSVIKSQMIAQYGLVVHNSLEINGLVYPLPNDVYMHITAQSGPVIQFMVCHSLRSSQEGVIVCLKRKIRVFVKTFRFYFYLVC